MSIGKENFLRTRLISCLQQLDPATQPKWGKMSVQHMIEHIGDTVRIANDRLHFDNIIVSPEHYVKLREFMLSNKPFRENTKNPLLKEEPGPLKFKTVQSAIGALQQELIYFFEAFEKKPDLVTKNPFFGDLNFEQNIHLLHKHSLHHLRQFGIEPFNSE